MGRLATDDDVMQGDGASRERSGRCMEEEREKSAWPCSTRAVDDSATKLMTGTSRQCWPARTRRDDDGGGGAAAAGGGGVGAAAAVVMPLFPQSFVTRPPTLTTATLTRQQTAARM